MAAVAFAGYEYEKYTANDQEQQEQQQLRGMSSVSSAEVYQLPQQLQQQPTQNTYMLLDQSSMGQMPQQSYGSSQQQALPKQELSLQELSPFPESVFSYTLFLASGICVWVLYLLMPRGVRKQ